MAVEGPPQHVADGKALVEQGEEELAQLGGPGSPGNPTSDSSCTVYFVRINPNLDPRSLFTVIETYRIASAATITGRWYHRKTPK